jgi:hypothetical protein
MGNLNENMMAHMQHRWEQRLTEDELQTLRSAIEGREPRVLPFPFAKRISRQFVIYG